jgi:deazaflavin-dependent oxidoreductase (nitroreductase family)
MATNWMQSTIDEFHTKGGRGIGPFGDNLLLLTAKGGRSGELHTAPLVCRRRGDDWVVVASKGGAPENPHWYRNVQANPEVEIEVVAAEGTERLRARARAVPSGPEHDELYAFMTEIWPGFADYQKRTTRTIPVVVLSPTKA